MIAVRREERPIKTHAIGRGINHARVRRIAVYAVT